MTEILPENVKEDNDLTKAEKETTINFDKESNKAHLFTSEGGLMRRMIQHPLFEINEYTEKDGKITSIKGMIPTTALSIGSTERGQKGHAQIVSNTVTQKEENAKVLI